MKKTREGTPLYKISYMQPHWVGFLRLFGLKMVIRRIQFAHFGLESALVFEGTTRVYEVFIAAIPNE